MAGGAGEQVAPLAGRELEGFADALDRLWGLAEQHLRGGVGDGAAATELQVVSLSDALALCLLVRDREPAKFTRLALRWHARFCAETSGVELETGRLVLDLLTAIGGPEAIPVARALRELVGCYDASLAEPIRGWEIEQAANR